MGTTSRNRCSAASTGGVGQPGLGHEQGDLLLLVDQSLGDGLGFGRGGGGEQLVVTDVAAELVAEEVHAVLGDQDDRGVLRHA